MHIYMTYLDGVGVRGSRKYCVFAKRQRVTGISWLEISISFSRLMSREQKLIVNDVVRYAALRFPAVSRRKPKINKLTRTWIRKAQIARWFDATLPLLRLSLSWIRGNQVLGRREGEGGIVLSGPCYGSVMMFAMRLTWVSWHSYKTKILVHGEKNTVTFSRHI